jgi:hypothetical protein
MSERDFFDVFLEPKQRGSDFWISFFSDFEFQLSTEFLGRKSLGKPYRYGKISWVLEGFPVKFFGGYLGRGPNGLSLIFEFNFFP